MWSQIFGLRRASPPEKSFLEEKYLFPDKITVAHHVNMHKSRLMFMFSVVSSVRQHAGFQVKIPKYRGPSRSHNLVTQGR